MSTQHPSVARQRNYFSLTPLMSEPSPYEHFTTESPCTSPILSPTKATSFPQHPLLARRESNFYAMPAASLLQLQTAAAHGTSPKRPQLQDVLHVTSDESASSNGSKDSTQSLYAAPEFARCSRCHRNSSLDRDGNSNMIAWSINSYYCHRCAEVVGLPKR